MGSRPTKRRWTPPYSSRRNQVIRGFVVPSGLHFSVILCCVDDDSIFGDSRPQSANNTIIYDCVDKSNELCDVSINTKGSAKQHSETSELTCKKRSPRMFSKPRNKRAVSESCQKPGFCQSKRLKLDANNNDDISVNP